MPRVGEVQLVLLLLDHADHIGPVVERLHERRDVTPTELVGEPLEVVEGEVLVGQEHDEVVVESACQLLDLVGVQRAPEIDAGDEGTQRPGGTFNLHGSTVTQRRR